MTARGLLARIEQKGGHILRFRELCVTVITANEELAQWLLDIGGVPFLPQNMTPTDDAVRGAFRDAPGGRPKWDIYIHLIPVKGTESVWQAAKRKDVDLYEVH